MVAGRHQYSRGKLYDGGGGGGGKRWYGRLTYGDKKEDTWDGTTVENTT